MNKFAILLLFLAVQPALGQQAYSTKSGRISFNASTPLEDIQAENSRVSAILVADTGDLGLVILIQDFVFPRALMQEHFNENYMESGRYPKATFRGGLYPVPDPGKLEGYKGEARGTLTMHGVSREVSLPVRLLMKNNTLRLASAFIVRPEDYEIEVPKLLFKKIAREVSVEAQLNLSPKDP